MYPLATPRAAAVFLGSAVVVVIGLLAVSGITVTLGATGLLGLSFAVAFSVPTTARLRRQRVELQWWHGHGDRDMGRAAVVGMPFEIRCQLSNRGARPVHLSSLAPVLPQGLHLEAGQPKDVTLPAGTRTELSLRIRADAVGRVVLQGLSVTAPGPLGLFASPLYFPSPLTIKVLPHAAQRGRALAPRGQRVERPGMTAVRTRGDGMELHELRELQPGDAFRSIAWRASARRGKLLVREMEREVQETLVIVVDISGSMRGGELGERPLDLAIQLAAFAARDALERGDLVGLITVDGRIVDHAQPASGLTHMPRVYRALLGATEVVDADLTEPSDDDVAAKLTRYLRQQDGLRLGQDQALNMDALRSRIRRALAGDDGASRIVGQAPNAEDSAMLRRYCQLRGIPLAYRADTRAFGKERGLSQALMLAAGRTRTPRSVLLLSDFDGVSAGGQLDKTLRLLQARAHRVQAVCPQANLTSAPPDTAPADSAPADSAPTGSTPATADTDDDRTRDAVHQVFAMQETRRLEALAARLSRLRTPFTVARPDGHATAVRPRVRNPSQVA